MHDARPAPLSEFIYFVLNSEDRVTDRMQTENLKHAEKSIQLSIYITRSL